MRDRCSTYMFSPSVVIPSRCQLKLNVGVDPAKQQFKECAQSYAGNEHPKTHKRFKRTPFSQTKQDRMRIFEEIVFFHCYEQCKNKSLIFLPPVASHGQMLIPANWQQKDTGFVCFCFVRSSEKRISSKIRILSCLITKCSF